ncbi:class I SAM-dependent methyltransferase [Spirosoma endbachense]|uniref:Methyltransferase domain-containing protein n=1 Tax=Spirosoma endbachense TaxID=2666025 RepID=A0A6P1VNS7_9BACT|nr:class I SAM-dependent methyltransferase [Spirosoma endbachense]QHV94743.1 methyltransferase domain-containing protein [Spirosoma endbachense]
MGKTTRFSSTFDWIAPVYDLLASVVFGRKLQQAQVVFLPTIPQNASVLLAGGGTGWLLEQLLVERNPRRVLYLEASAQMVALTSQRIIQKAVLGTVEYRVDTIMHLHKDEQFDIVITPFLLDLFPEETLQSTLLPQLRNALKPNGIWLVTDFVVTDVWWQKTLLWTMIRFFRLTAGIGTTQLADWQRLLAEAGLSLQKRQPCVGGMVSTEVWHLK